MHCRAENNRVAAYFMSFVEYLKQYFKNSCDGIHYSKGIYKDASTGV